VKFQNSSKLPFSVSGEQCFMIFLVFVWFAPLNGANQAKIL
jgi:hypothetical protein